MAIIWNTVNVLITIYVTSIQGISWDTRKSQGLTAFPADIIPLATHVNLEDNRITSIPANALENNSGNTWLNLAKNQIDTFSTDAFRGTILHSIFLNENPIKTIPYFANIDTTLKGLVLTKCSITNANKDLVLPYTGINFLNLAINDLQQIPDLTKSKATLVNLNLEECGITEIEPNHFTGFNGLTHLYLARNKFITLKDYTFTGLSTLVYLNLDGSKDLLTTEPLTFYGLSQLKQLHIVDSFRLTTMPCVGPFAPNLTLYHAFNNKIESLPTNCSGFTQTTKFSMNNNNFQNGNFSHIARNLRKIEDLYLESVGKLCVELSAINKMKEIQTFWLKDNMMGHFPAESCDRAMTKQDEGTLHLPLLREISVSGNGIKAFPNVSLLANLTHIYFSNNQLTTIPKKVFLSCQNLQHLDFSQNLLIEPPDLTGGCTKLHTLCLERNKISAIPEGYFNGCSALTTVLLSFNLLTSFPDFNPVGKTLVNVTLISNSIAGTLKADAFLNMSRIETIKLARNKIEHFEVAALRYTHNLTSLELTENIITTLEDPFSWCAGPTCSKMTLNLTENRLNCDSNLCWFKRLSAPSQIRIDDCFGKDWNQVTNEDLKCPVELLMKVSHRQGTSALFANLAVQNLTSTLSALSTTTTYFPFIEDCTVWCAQNEKCITFKHTPKTSNNAEGMCAIKTN